MAADIVDVVGPSVVLTLNRKRVALARDVFATLFHNSVVAGYSDVAKALDGETLNFDAFLDLTRKAEIPYPLFFAPLAVVEEQVRLKNQKLMAGFSKPSFSMQSRHRVELRDIELIVKDLLRKQEWLRRFDSSLVRNELVGVTKRSRRAVVEDARRIAGVLDLDIAAIRTPKSKETALQLLVRQLEANQVLVSQSSHLHMPQLLDGPKFSGITLKDKKVPFIFLASGDEGEGFEPAGRRVFTLMLMTVLIAQGQFEPVKYEGHTRDEDSPRAHEVAAELLMPAAEVREMALSDLDAVTDAGNRFKVTPSAVVMRAWRLRCIDYVAFSEFMEELERARPGKGSSSPRSQPIPVRALKKYNGIECSRRMLGLLDAGHINATEFRRVVLLNKVPQSQINDFRAEVG